MEDQFHRLQHRPQPEPGTTNSVSLHHRMILEDDEKMSFASTKPNLEKRRMEQEHVALQSQQQSKRIDNAEGSMTDHIADQTESMSDIAEDPLSPTMLTSPWEQATSHSNNLPEVRRLSGNFNAPTHVEGKRHNDLKSPRGFRGAVKGWVKRSPSSTVA